MSAMQNSDQNVLMMRKNGVSIMEKFAQTVVLFGRFLECWGWFMTANRSWECWECVWIKRNA